MTKQINILSTKKLLPNQKEILSDTYFNLSDVNFIETKTINFELATLNDNLIFTSKNAVESILYHSEIENLKQKNVFCVGLKTKAFLEELGFNVIAYTGYASDLAEIICLIYKQETFTFLSGNLRRDVLPNILKENGVVFNEIEVYETCLTPSKIVSKYDALLFFSPSAVESYLSLNKIQDEVCFCIGETTASVLEAKNIINIIIANKPNVDAVILKINEYYNR